jgi:hypothetical protein
MQQNQDLSMFAYRLDGLEKDIERLNMQLSNYVPVRENELKLQSIQDIVKRIEAEITGAKLQLTDINKQLDKQRESQDKLQIRMLYGIVATIVTVLSGILIGYITHILG